MIKYADRCCELRGTVDDVLDELHIIVSAVYGALYDKVGEEKAKNYIDAVCQKVFREKRQCKQYKGDTIKEALEKFCESKKEERYAEGNDDERDRAQGNRNLCQNREAYAVQPNGQRKTGKGPKCVAVHSRQSDARPGYISIK